MKHLADQFEQVKSIGVFMKCFPESPQPDIVLQHSTQLMEQYMSFDPQNIRVIKTSIKGRTGVPETLVASAGSKAEAMKIVYGLKP